MDGKRDTKGKNTNRILLLFVISDQHIVESDFSDSEEEDEFYRQVKKLKEARRERIQQEKQVITLF